MFTAVETHPPLKSRQQAFNEIGRAMERFSLIVDILGELGKAEIPFPGDSDIRHGCDRALTAMLVALARIEPVVAGEPAGDEKVIFGMLHRQDAGRLVDSDQLQRMHQFVERILGASGEHH